MPIAAPMRAQANGADQGYINNLFTYDMLKVIIIRTLPALRGPVGCQCSTLAMRAA
jgi:hypothetical protein